MRSVFGALLLVLLQFPVFAQKHVRMQASPDIGPEATVFDSYLSSIQPGDTGMRVRLWLQHCEHCDDGDFGLNKMRGNEISYIIDGGKWTVLKGSAKDDNATVVELDGKGATLYYLRLSNGDLQQLDSLLREMKPVKNYMLLKQ